LRKIDTMVIHCSDSNFGDAKIIDSWHKERGFREIGYNYVILNGQKTPRQTWPDFDGVIEPGRNLDNDTWVEESEIGAHALGFNDRSIGVCLIGGQDGTKTAFTIKQYWSALLLAAMWKRVIPDIKILGHNETGANKACPAIDMNLFRERLTAVIEGGLSFVLLKIDMAQRGI
jgi:N-acetylmuramoyl-L-alanine amidase